MSTEKALTDQPRRPDDISVRGLILKIQEYFFAILRWWWAIGVVGGLWAVKDFRNIAKIKPVYPGEVILLVKPQDMSKENKSKVLIYSRFINARKSVGDVILQYADTTQKDLVIDRYIKTYLKYQPEGLPDFIPADFTFQNRTPDTFTDLERSIFQAIVNKLITYVPGYADGFINVSVDESLGLVTISIATPTEDLTMLMLEKLKENFETLSLNYSIFAEKIAYDNFKKAIDSLENNYRYYYYRLLKARNEHKRLFDEDKEKNARKLRRLERTIAKMEIEADLYKTNLDATLQHLRSAQEKMNAQMPVIETIQEPLRPLEPYQPSPISAAIMGAIKGVFLLVFMIVLVKVVTDILKEEEVVVP